MCILHGSNPRPPAVTPANSFLRFEVRRHRPLCQRGSGSMLNCMVARCTYPWGRDCLEGLDGLQLETRLFSREGGLCFGDKMQEEA